MRFEFATASRIIFGSGSAERIPDHAHSLGTKACLVTGGNTARHQWLLDGLKQKNLNPLVISIGDEPETGTISSAVEKIRATGCDVVVAVGGGSVLDAGKALAALAANPGDIFDYLEVVGEGQPLLTPSLPHIAAPTTSGTGSEVTANAVLLSAEHGVKVSMRSKDMLPTLAVIDPKLTLSLPRSITASTGLDALTQLIEAFVSNKANPVTNGLCRQGLCAAKSLGKACDQGANLDAREDMALASLLSGMALANAKLGAVHGLAAPIGGMFKAPHGAVCAALLPHIMAENIKALEKRAPDSPALEAYAETARILTDDSKAAPHDGVEWVRGLCQKLKIPPLSAYGLTENDFPEIAMAAMRSSSMQGNPVELGKNELRSALLKSL